MTDRVKELLEELKTELNADSISLEAISRGLKFCDYILRIDGCRDLSKVKGAKV